MKFLAVFAILEFVAIYFLAKKKTFGFLWVKQTLIGPDGTSAKRVTAFWFVVLITVMHIVYLYAGLKIEPHVFPEFVTLVAMDELFVLLLLAVVTAQDIIKYKSGKDENKPE